MFEFVVLSGLTCAGVLFCLTKWGALGHYQVFYRKRWMPSADCYFCMSFWLAITPTLFYLEMTIGERFALAQLPTVSDAIVTLLGILCSLAAATLSSFICTVIIQPEGIK